MADQQPQQKAEQASAQPQHGNISAAEIEKFIGGMDFPAEKQDLVEHAKGKGAHQEVLDFMNQFPDKEYGNAVDVSRGVSQVKH